MKRSNGLIAAGTVLSLVATLDMLRLQKVSA